MSPLAGRLRIPHVSQKRSIIGFCRLRCAVLVVILIVRSKQRFTMALLFDNSNALSV